MLVSGRACTALLTSASCDTCSPRLCGHARCLPAACHVRRAHTAVLLIHLSNLTGLSDDYSKRTMALLVSDIGTIVMGVTAAFASGWIKVGGWAAALWRAGAGEWLVLCCAHAVTRQGWGTARPPGVNVPPPQKQRVRTGDFLPAWPAVRQLDLQACSHDSHGGVRDAPGPVPRAGQVDGRGERVSTGCLQLVCVRAAGRGTQLPRALPVYAPVPYEVGAPQGAT